MLYIERHYRHVGLYLERAWDFGNSFTKRKKDFSKINVMNTKHNNKIKK